MKPTTITQILLPIAISTIGSLLSQVASAQLPPIVNNQAELRVTETPNNNAPQDGNIANAGLRVSCQNLTTVVQKGDRQATMLTWNYSGFGREFTPEKRCQIVSERLQQAANINGGTFKDLQIATGTVNSQAVICALRSNSNKCTRKNLLFTLSPENARNPDAVIQKMFSFAADGSSSINESATNSSPKFDVNLGNWEQKAFPRSQKSTPNNRRKIDTGF
ncbi:MULTISPECIES: COP23 domain-containing protein [unclassified Chamaesiphon]|uniref:COP23 domain-containing protein n=1 Tax=unclassified Chamaesiphon TaxID=2620921 RepID=UPI00286A0ACB|nr:MULTISPECIES: COP23 domain-containing protein [unclassified Chamaesiphon]